MIQRLLIFKMASDIGILLAFGGGARWGQLIQKYKRKYLRIEKNSGVAINIASGICRVTSIFNLDIWIRNHFARPQEPIPD